jgi:oxygen-independent coproporphyrinogen-3 oxidase
VSAISHVGGTFAQNHREMAAWEDDIGADRLPVARGYVQSKDDSIRGAVIEECLCNGRISKEAIETRFRIRFDEYFMRELMRLYVLECDGLIEGRTSRTIRITPAGRVFSRAVAKVFDAFQPSPVASQAV